MKKLNIIYEDKELLVVEKESHQLTITTETIQFDSYEDVWNTNVEIIDKLVFIRFGCHRSTNKSLRR